MPKLTRRVLDEIKNSQVIDDEGVTKVRRVYNLFDLSTRGLMTEAKKR